jgi:hypothetical protein
MRTEVLTYMRGLALGTFNVSDKIPRNESAEPLYMKNPKTMYVDVAQFEDNPLINTLGGLSIHAKTTSLSVYFSVDAKNLPNNYDALVSSLLDARDLNTTEGFNDRSAEVSTSIEADMLVTEVTLSYTKLR